MEHPGEQDEPRPALRIAGYVRRYAALTEDPPPAPAGESSPAPPRRPLHAPGVAGHQAPAPPHSRVGPPPEGVRSHGAGPRRARRPDRRPAAFIAALTCLVVALLLLARPLVRTHQRAKVTPQVNGAASAGVAPTATDQSSAAPALSPPVPRVRTPTSARTHGRAAFELVDGVTELSVRTGDLDGRTFRVSTPEGSGLRVGTSFSAGILKVSTEASGSGHGSGKVDVLLSEDLEWRLRMRAGVRTVTFDMGSGTVRDVELIGGARTATLKLGRLDDELPILMTGGVHTWNIETAEEVPIRVSVRKGAGDVSIYGSDEGGVEAGDTIRSGGHAVPGLDIDAAAGVGALSVTAE